MESQILNGFKSNLHQFPFFYLNLVSWISEFPDIVFYSGRLFKEFDRDGDKSITTDELKQLISSVKFGEFQMKEEDVLKALFKDFDEDNNNIIDEPEFVEGVKKWLSKAIFDTNTQEPAKIINEYDNVSSNGIEYQLLCTIPFHN